LLRLDGTAVAASRNVVLSQLRDAFARLARLEAEVSGADQPVISDLLPADVAGLEFDEFVEMQQALITARANGRAGRRDQLLQQINQARSKISGLEAQRTVSEAQLTIVSRELADLDELRADGLVNNGRVNDLALRRHELEGSIAQVASGVAELEATIAEREAALAVEDDNLRSEVLAEQQSVRAELARLLQQQIALEAQLREFDIRAPMAGTVHGSVVHTVGGVIGSGETAMTIIPALQRTAIDVRVRPLDIEAVASAQEVFLKFPGLDPRDTPDLLAEIASVSPDLSTAPGSDAEFYLARIIVQESELDRLPDHIALAAGMPVDAFIKTSDRTVLDFLLRPLTDLVARAFRED
jgi:HlyD family secretion protein